METNTFHRLSGENLKIAIVQARFNRQITDGLLDGALQALKESNVKEENMEIFRVPGSFEIPILCKNLAKLDKFDGIITLGAIIRGETQHCEYIAKATTEGIMKISLNNNIPITLGVITTNNLEQAKKRASDKNNKGYEAAMALIDLVKSLEKI